MNGAITECPKCLLKHNSEDHVLKRLHAICPTIAEFPDKSHMIEIFLMRHIYDYAKQNDDVDRDKSNVLVHAFFNLHRSVHAKSCFKYGLECRKWRFIEDPEWGEVLGRLRMSTPTESDITVFNPR
eukprot:scaffold55649_cov43-Attheya_sp.AAC.1